MNKLTKVLSNPWITYAKLSSLGLTEQVSDEAHLRMMWKAFMGCGKRLDLADPRTFNEKLQWLKLHDRNPLYTTLVDKYAVKEWAADKVGPEHVTRTYAKWDRAEDINIAFLPEKFVLKTNHDCGGVVICSNRDSFDFEAAKCKLSKHMKRNYFYWGREWPYKNVKPCIFAEEYLSSGNKDDNDYGLTDYKMFHFSNGRIITLVCENRFGKGGLKETFFDEEWMPLEVARPRHERNPKHVVPKTFVQMKRMCNTLAAGLPFCRVDFFEVAGRCYFGEMTFYPASGFTGFVPEAWDVEFGSWITLPELS